MFTLITGHTVKTEGVFDGPDFEGFDKEVDLHLILKVEGGMEFALGPYPGPAPDLGFTYVHQFGVEALEETAFGGLHPAEEMGEVYDPGHVGFTEFDLSAVDEGVGHRVGVGVVDEKRPPLRERRPWEENGYPMAFR